MSDEQNNYNENPIILVFYLDSDMMKNNQETVKEFSDNVNRVIEEKNANIINFFMATEGEERIECINPDITDEHQKKEINTLLDDIRNKFDMHSNDIPKDDEDTD